MRRMEEEYFGRVRPAFGRLEEYGFRKTESGFIYAEDFMDGQFRAELELQQVTAEPAGENAGNREWSILGRVIDLDTGEEYLPIRARHQVGGFVGSVREAYLELLGRIREMCFHPVDFMYDQANRIAARIGEVYGDTVEFPWEKYPGNGTFKCAGSDKWYAALLTVAYGKLEGLQDSGDAGRNEKDSGKTDPEQIMEVINVKADPEKIPELTKTPGIYPAWHMNKKHWISVILNDTLPDDAVWERIEESHTLVEGGKTGGKVRSGAWIIPSNPKVYDIDAGFEQGGGVIEWHQHNNILPGDEVYIYSAAPNSAILYRTVVEDSDLTYDGMFRDKESYVRSMRIRLIEKYPKDRYPLAFMKDNGGSVIRSARRMPEELLRAMKTRR